MTTPKAPVITTEDGRFVAEERLTAARARLAFFANRPPSPLGEPSQDLERARAVVAGLQHIIGEYDAAQDAERERVAAERKAAAMSEHIAVYAEAAAGFADLLEAVLAAAEQLAEVGAAFSTAAAQLDRLETAACDRHNGDRVLIGQHAAAWRYAAHQLYRSPLPAELVRFNSGHEVPRPTFAPAQTWTPAIEGERQAEAERKAARDAERAAAMAAQPYAGHRLPVLMPLSYGRD